MDMESGLLTAFALAMALVVIIKLFRKDFAFKPLAITLEGTLIYINLINIVYMLTRMSREIMRDYRANGLPLAIAMIIAAALVIFYYAKSDRGKSTFHKKLYTE